MLIEVGNYYLQASASASQVRRLPQARVFVERWLVTGDQGKGYRRDGAREALCVVNGKKCVEDVW
jgi:hypothetical protein